MVSKQINKYWNKKKYIKTLSWQASRVVTYFLLIFLYFFREKVDFSGFSQQTTNPSISFTLVNLNHTFSQTLVTYYAKLIIFWKYSFFTYLIHLKTTFLKKKEKKIYFYCYDCISFYFFNETSYIFTSYSEEKYYSETQSISIYENQIVYK